MKWFRPLALAALTLAVIVFLLITAILVPINPLFLEAEYNAHSFPPDTYGFTTQERLQWSKIAVQYLLNDQGGSFLGDLTFADGSPVYNERELSHMLDVKNLVQSALLVWSVLLILLVTTWFLARRSKGLPGWYQSLSRGGWILAGLVVAILLTVAISFNELFTVFHRIFFQGDSWLFLFSDTLIRLFPIRFWQDAFILVGVIALVTGLGSGYAGWRLLKRLR
jgi:integral membrane protein (TIGR01906 family)